MIKNIQKDILNHCLPVFILDEETDITGMLEKAERRLLKNSCSDKIDKNTANNLVKKIGEIWLHRFLFRDTICLAYYVEH